MKDQDKTPEKQQNEVEIGNLTEKEFIIIIAKTERNDQSRKLIYKQ